MTAFRSVKDEVTQTLEDRRELATWLESAAGKRWAMQTSLGEESPLDQVAIAGAAAVLTAGLREATPYFVTEDLVDLAEAAANHATFPGWSVAPTDLPSPVGFVRLARPVWFPLEEGATPLPAEVRRLGIAGMAWDGVRAMDGRTRKDKFVAWTLLDTGEAVADGVNVGGLPSLLPTGYATLPFLADGWTTDTDAPNAEMRFLKTLWLLMQQTLTETRTHRGPRHEVRKAERKGRKIPTVVVVTLRRAVQATAAYDREHTHREYSHRFIVGGHWRVYRAERYSEEVRANPRWISPFIKGDPDKPLVVKEKIYRLAR